MWLLVRFVALAVLVVGGLLLAGQGGWLLDVADRVATLAGAGAALPRAEADPSRAAALAGIAVGVLAALVRPLDRVVGQLVTLLHELGHTLVAAALGARPAGIVLRHDASGHATARWVGRASPVRRLGLALVAFAGLPTAAAVSAAGARLLLLAGPEAVLWSFAAAGAAVALLARSLWSLLVAGGIAGLALVALSDAAEPWAVGAVVGVLVATAVKTTADNARAVRQPLRSGDDARVVGGHLRLPSRLVQFLQVAVATALGVWTVWLLLPELPAVS